jgi:sec-independent protein translocase protein TatC
MPRQSPMDLIPIQMSLESLPFQAHLQELRRRTIVYFITVLVLFVVCYACSEFLVSFLFYPIRQALPPGSTLVFTALTEGFIAYLKVAFWSALTLSTPVFLYQAWQFTAPGLHEREKRFASIFLIWGIGLFAAGGLFGYWVIMPVVLSISLGFANQGLEAMPRLQNYLLFTLKTIFVFGLVFEIPFLMACATRTGIVAPNYYARYRKVIYVVLFLLSVMMVPTDLFSQILLFLPLAGMYEAGVRLSRWLGHPGKQRSDE